MTISAADGEVMADGSVPARPAIDDAWRRSSLRWRLAAIVAAVTGVAMALLGHVPLASGLAVAVLVPPALIDVHYRRLPNRWVGAAALTFAIATILQFSLGQPVDLASAALGALVVAGPMLALHLMSPAAMGFGDVKAGLVLGACLGAVDWQLALAGLALAAGATSVTAIVRNRSIVAFGPGLVAGSLIALAAHTTFVVAPDTFDAASRPVVDTPVVDARDARDARDIDTWEGGEYSP